MDSDAVGHFAMSEALHSVKSSNAVGTVVGADVTGNASHLESGPDAV